MKRTLLTITLMLVFVAAYSLQISEFVVTPTESEALELHNETASSIEMSDYTFVLTGLSANDTVTFPAGALAADGYISYDPSVDLGTNTLSNNGMTITILDASSSVVDEVSYGSFGKVPAPIYNWSTARVSSTGDNAVDFNIDDTPTIGSANDAASTALGSGTVFFNEVYPDTNNGYADQYIEIYNSGATGVDISGWCVVCGDDYYFPASTVIAGDGYFVINKADFPTYFYMDHDYEHLYLFDDAMQRVDQIGWDFVEMGYSFSCMPNGDRNIFDGFDDATTTDFVDTLPTKGASNSPAGIIETVNSDLNYTVSSLSGVGIDIKGELDNAEISIMDVTGRTIYTSNFKNMIFATKSGVYFVNVRTSDKTYTHKIEVIK